MKPSVLCTLTSGLAIAVSLVVSQPVLAQKADTVSPNEPKVTICHNGRSITVAQSSVSAHLTHGDTLGPCGGSEAKVLICHSGHTLFVTQAALAGHLSHGDTLGECSTAARSEVSAPAAARTGLGTPVPPQPVTPIAKPAAPAQTPQTPSIKDDVEVCYKGHTVTVTRTSIQTYLSIGATLGPCAQKTDKVDATENTEETTEATK